MGRVHYKHYKHLNITSNRGDWWNFLCTTTMGILAVSLNEGRIFGINPSHSSVAFHKETSHLKFLLYEMQHSTEMNTFLNLSKRAKQKIRKKQIIRDEHAAR